jgi:hypothetical protein
MSQTLKQRMILDHHTKQRQAAIKMEAKRQRALEFLGVKWVLHPENPAKPVKGIYSKFGMRLS